MLIQTFFTSFMYMRVFVSFRYIPWQGHMVTLCGTFIGTASMFSKAPFYIPTSTVKGPLSLQL